ncbi:MAG: DMT family transporter [Yoonia sp.]|uniref:DMT family transporter n=1 Tax=Yoonia sp. TaxID=2212373 RepID=UPI0032670EBA
MTGSFQLRVVAMVVGAMILIVGGDVAGRMLTSAGFSQFFVAWTRFALAAFLLAPVVGLQEGEMRLLLKPALMFRACLIAGGIASILTALKTEQLATVFGGFFVGPIISYALSAIFLKEKVTVPRTVLLLVSFGGVLLVVKPGFGMTPGLGFALLAGVFHGSYLVATRWLAGSYRPRFLLFSQLVIGSIVLAPLAIAPLPSMTLPFVGFITISAMGSAIGNLLLVHANRAAEASVIAPLIYSQIIIATVFGFLFFGEWPDSIALLGLAVIITAGAGSIWAAGRAK